MHMERTTSRDVMQTPPKLQCFILDTGYCLAWEHHMMQRGQRRKIACHSLVALLCHPTHGWILWDTGYAPHMLTATQLFPYSLYRLATPLVLTADLSVVQQLRRWKLRAEDIGHVIISHFHADHIAGLHDFPAAKLLANEAAYTDVAGRRGLQALQRAFIPTLLPADFERRAELISTFTGPALADLGTTHDLFGDGSLLLIALPGHTRGQIGLLAETERGRVLFAADSCWLRQAIYEQRPPSLITHLFIDDARAVCSTLRHLHDFALANSDVVIIPSHCPVAYAQEVEKKYAHNKSAFDD